MLGVHRQGRASRPAPAPAVHTRLLIRPRHPKPRETAPPASPQIVSGTMDVSGCSFLEEEQKAAGFVLTCTRARAIPARASSGASATAPPWPPHGRLPQGSVGLVRGSAGVPDGQAGLDASEPRLFSLAGTAKPTSDVVIETHKEDDLH